MKPALLKLKKNWSRALFFGNLCFSFSGPKVTIFTKNQKFLKLLSIGPIILSRSWKNHNIWKKTLAATDSFVYMVQNLSFGRDIYSAVCSSPNGQKCQTIPQTQVTYTWGTLLAIKIMELGLGVLSYLVAPVKNSHLKRWRNIIFTILATLRVLKI